LLLQFAGILYKSEPTEKGVQSFQEHLAGSVTLICAYNRIFTTIWLLV